jgi:two-component system, NtrC family, response regulator HydG
MSGSRLALVADDPRFAGAVQAHLRKALGQPVFQCTYASVRPHLAPDVESLLLLAVSAPAEAEQAVRLVQEICLRKLPPVLMTLEGAPDLPGDPLAVLEPYLARRLRWPAEPHLADLIRLRLGPALEPAEVGPETIEDVISRRLLQYTPSLVPLTERVALAAAHDVTVLLTGETGTGKTHLARLLHDCSPRKASPFLTVPCGAQPANLLESAFFGHVKGAFTGATERKVGKFEAAGNGTILLDEIDTLGMEQQAGLLRVIETGEFEPVGSNETKLCTARIIVASNWDLETAVRQGKFREDLFYRLNVMSFHLPSLRDRVEDIAPLVRGMAARFNTKFRKHLFDVHPSALEVLEAHPWPGNIRQLENCVQQAVLLSSGPELLPEHLPPQVRDPKPGPGVSPGAPPVLSQGTKLTDRTLAVRDQIEKNEIQRALANNGYSRSRAARALGISRVTLYKKMKKYGLMHAPANGHQG